MTRMVLVLVLVCSLVGLVDAQTRYTGDMTVTEFRALGSSLQTGYVTGFISYSNLMGVRCYPPRSVGEYVAAIVNNSLAFKHDEKVNEAFFNFMIDNGCKVTGK